MALALNNPQRLKCHLTKTPKALTLSISLWRAIYFSVSVFQIYLSQSFNSVQINLLKSIYLSVFLVSQFRSIYDLSYVTSLSKSIYLSIYLSHPHIAKYFDQRKIIKKISKNSLLLEQILCSYFLIKRMVIHFREESFSSFFWLWKWNFQIVLFYIYS